MLGLWSRFCEISKSDEINDEKMMAVFQSSPFGFDITRFWRTESRRDRNKMDARILTIKKNENENVKEEKQKLRRKKCTPS